MCELRQEVLADVGIAERVGVREDTREESCEEGEIRTHADELVVDSWRGALS